MAREAIIQKYATAINETFHESYEIAHSKDGYYLQKNGIPLTTPFRVKNDFEKAVKMIYSVGNSIVPMKETITDEEAIKKFAKLKYQNKSPEEKARIAEVKRKWISKPENRDRKNALKRERYKNPELNAIYREKQREYINRPDVKARRKAQEKLRAQNKKEMLLNAI